MRRHYIVLDADIFVILMILARSILMIQKQFIKDPYNSKISIANTGFEPRCLHCREPNVRGAAVERIWLISDSHGQILALAIR